MSQLAPDLTESGLALLIEALDGDGIEFTKIVLGDGKPPGTNRQAARMTNPIIEVGITNLEKHENFVLLTGEYDNGSLTGGFYANELGVFAKNSEGQEVLYAYSYSSEYVDFIPDKDSGRIVETQISIIVSIGEAENVTAILTEAAVYASKQELQNHMNDTRNPHKVTKEDIGLGNVQNVEFGENTTDFTEAKSATNIEPSDSMKVILGKVKKFFSDYLAHLKATNPHKINAATINSGTGTISIERGGTGASTAANSRKNLGVNAIYQTRSYTSGIIQFASSGAYVSTTIPIESISGYTAVAIAQWQIINDSTSGSNNGLVDLNNVYFSGNNVICHLVNRKTSANHCKFWFSVLYIKNL